MAGFYFSSQSSPFSFSNPPSSSSSSSSQSSPFSFSNPPSSSSSSSSQSSPFSFSNLPSSSSSSSSQSSPFSFSNPPSSSSSSSSRSSPSLFHNPPSLFSSSSQSSPSLFNNVPPSLSSSSSQNLSSLFTNPSSSSLSSSSTASPFSLRSSAPSTGFSLASSASSASAPSFGFGSSSASTAPSFGFGSSSSLAPSSAASFGFGVSTSAASSTTPAPVSSPFGAFGSAARTGSSSLFGTLSSTTTSSTAFPASNLFSSASAAAPGITANLFGSLSTGSSTTAAAPGTNLFPSSSFALVSATTSTNTTTSGINLFGTSSSVPTAEGEEVVQGEDEQFRNEVVKQPLAETIGQKAVEGLVSVSREEKNESREVFDSEEAGVQESVASAPTIPILVSAVTFATAPAVEATVDTTMTSLPKFAAANSAGAMLSGENVEGGRETAPITVNRGVNIESDLAASVAATRAKAGVCRVGTQTTPLLSQHIDANEYLISPENRIIVKRILDKYGDITMESILKGMPAKLAILDLVADVVSRLCSHTIKTLGPDDLQLIEANTADAVAVGFNVEWLRESVDRVNLARNYQVHLTELDNLGQEIEIAKKSLTEMEHRHMDLKMVVASIEDQMDVNGAERSSLGEGLL